MGHGNRGFVLVSVLWILAILTLVALGFARRAMLERQMAWYALDREQALQMARGAVERGIVELSNRQVLDSYNDQEGYTSLNQRWAQPLDLLKEENGEYYTLSEDEGFEDEVCMYSIYDCEGRVSINHASERLLSRLEGLNQGTVRRIISRRVSQEQGDRVQRFMTIEELRSFDSVSPADWYGDHGGEGLRDVLTVWGSRGGQININTASETVLRAIPDLKGKVVDGIIAYRLGSDGIMGTRDDRAFRNLEMVSERLGMRPNEVGNLSRYCKTYSEFFTINAVATRRHGKIRAFCSATVSVKGGVKVLEWKEDPFAS